MCFSWLTLTVLREDDQTEAFRGSKSRNKVSVGEPAEGSLERGEGRENEGGASRPNSTDRSPATKTVVLWRGRRMWGRGLGLVWGGGGKMARGCCWYGRWGVVVQTTTPCWLDLSAAGCQIPCPFHTKKPHTPRPRVSLQPMCTIILSLFPERRLPAMPGKKTTRNQKTTLNSGSLGSCVDEERSKARKVV